MCLILIAWRVHPEYPLVLAGNRDEAYERPSLAADFWKDDPRIFGGRDLEKGGTWLAIARSGRFGAVTNFREGAPRRDAPRSRGELVADFVRGTEEPRAYLERIARHDSSFGGYTLIVGDREQLYAYSNRGGSIVEVAPGVHGLSNHLLDTPWPKVVRGKERLAAQLAAPEDELVAEIFAILADRTLAPDSELPDTGVGLERERALSPAFIAGERYGTRASTVLLVRRTGEVLFAERAFGPRGLPAGASERRFSLDADIAPGRCRAAGQLS